MPTFEGFTRPDGTAGIRNYVAVMPSVACANGVVSAISRELPESVPLLHGHGCSRGGGDVVTHFRTLVNLAANPNVHAVLVVGLGCEVLGARNLAQAMAQANKRVECLIIQEEGGSRRAAARGSKIVRSMLGDAAKQRRSTCDLSALRLGLECGGSDAFSGITANPAVGLVSDWLVEQGGTCILTETTEMIGTSHIMERRSKTGEVAVEIAGRIAEAEKKTKEVLGPLASLVIAPGNMDGGMSSISEKSLGCILKGGSSSINQVVNYAEIPNERGLVVMDGPGYDVESMTGLAGSGCQIIIFTTGRGNPLGFPLVPVIKVASTSRLYSSMEDDMDINAGVVLDGKTLQVVAEDIKALVLKVASGEKTKAEMNRQDGILCLYTTTPSF